MRTILLTSALLLLGACAMPGPMQSAGNQTADLSKYVEPSNGAAYSQSDLYYYTENANPNAIGGPGAPVRTK